MNAKHIASIVDAQQVHLVAPEASIETLLTDSRQLIKPEGTLFFAIPTPRNTGCRYIADLHRQGVRNFVVPVADYDPILRNHPDANIVAVQDVVLALQTIATHHRQQFSIPVVGITGSNGKTIVKDWLTQLLSSDYHLATSPKSYNSQIGVPLSVWQLKATDQMAIFEAGISCVGEMQRLQPIINPTIGIFTNIGAAHDENFTSRQQKATEKLKLFAHSEVLISSSSCLEVQTAIATSGLIPPSCQRITWGTAPTDQVHIVDTRKASASTLITLASSLPTSGNSQPFTVEIPFTDQASIEDAMHCITLMLHLGYAPSEIAARCKMLSPIEMRMELKEAINDCLLINDSYSLDLNSLIIALDFMQRERQGRQCSLLMSDFVQSGMQASELYGRVAELIRNRDISRLIAIGPEISACRAAFSNVEATFFDSTDDFLSRYNLDTFRNEVLLLKGARKFGFETIARRLQRHSHESIMEVNLSALIHNLNYYRSRIRPSTRLMAMVKASSYGAGTVEVARALQFNHADYLTVAYADEGVELRQHGITLPIMVMNPEPSAFDDIISHHLEPDVYSLDLIERIAARVRHAGQGPIAVHIEFDTGMHRLGFGSTDIEPLASRLAALNDAVVVRSIFSHLACSDEPENDDFTRRQIARFDEWSAALTSRLSQPQPPLRHLLNSSGITRFPEAQFDMVRLGIGLYGISPESEVQQRLRQVSRLIAHISQVKAIPQDDSVGYSRRWVAARPSRIAIIPVGYADGIHRRLGNGHGHVLVHGHEAPIIGNVCMDMCFIDVTDIPSASEGDEVVVFGEGDLLQRNATAAGTIPYELLTAIAPRVKRIYIQDE